MNNLPEELQERIDIINHKLKFTDAKPMVACIVALNPLQLATDELAEQITRAGGISIAGDADTMLQLNPDVIILKPQGYSIEQTISTVASLFDLDGFADLKAVKSNRFYIVDGDQAFKSNEETYVDAVELLAEIIYPKQFIFGHEGEGWVKFSL
ncbi:ABC transporter substrate-binding protein [Mucilaginibacter antarcticus]|uniref:ABC transporter substrate-binding protein n=1 Tax=Mucilaginibacter antarcticus TaxID=1855725 RepID=A0ABW5XR33_9SPHI